MLNVFMCRFAILQGHGEQEGGLRREKKSGKHHISSEMCNRWVKSRVFEIWETNTSFCFIKHESQTNRGESKEQKG